MRVEKVQHTHRAYVEASRGKKLKLLSPLFGFTAVKCPVVGRLFFFTDFFSQDCKIIKLFFNFSYDFFRWDLCAKRDC